MLTKCYHCGATFDRDVCPDCRAGLGPDERIAALEAELQPWREMARQLEALRGDEYWWSSSYKTGCDLDDFETPYYEVVFRCVRGATRPSVCAYGATLPAAVAAAYERVMGVGDE